MIFQEKETLAPALKKDLRAYVYDIVGVIQDVYKELPSGLPEYIYQEALQVALQEAGIPNEKEFVCHPVFRGKPLESFMKMDFMIPRQRGNIVVEVKAIEKLTSKEHQQLFSYLSGTRYPVGILVNFHGFPHVTIHKFYFDRSDNTITAF